MPEGKEIRRFFSLIFEREMMANLLDSIAPKDVDVDARQWEITGLFDDPNRHPVIAWLRELINFWKEHHPDRWTPYTDAGPGPCFRGFSYVRGMSLQRILEKLTQAGWLTATKRRNLGRNALGFEKAYVPSKKLLAYLLKFHNTASTGWEAERAARTERWDDSERKGREAQREHRYRKEQHRKEQLGF